LFDYLCERNAIGSPVDGVKRQGISIDGGRMDRKRTKATELNPQMLRGDETYSKLQNAPNRGVRTSRLQGAHILGARQRPNSRFERLNF
jgi:hypothetical protein